MILRICVRVAQQTLTLYVWVRILDPQPKNEPTQTGRFFRSLAADLSLRTPLRTLALGIGFGFPAQSATSLLDRGKRGNFRASREYPRQKKDQVERLGLFSTMFALAGK